MHANDAVPTALPESLAILCTLDATDFADRIAEFRSLFIAALRSHVREPSQLLLLLSVPPEGEAGVRELFEREAACCSFFSCTFHREGGLLVASMKAPEARAPLLNAFEELARQSEAAASR